MDGLDPEIRAMEKTFSALEELEDEKTRQRVIEWLIKKFDLEGLIDQKKDEAVSETTKAENKLDLTMFSDLYDMANPSTDLERVIVGGYWLQIKNNQATWNSFSVNRLLKDVGYGVASISKSFDRAQNQKPALVRQTSKSGNSQQAKKTYRLTQAGIRFVENLCLSGSNYEN